MKYDKNKFTKEEINKLKRLDSVIEAEQKRNAPPIFLQAVADQWAEIYNKSKALKK